METGDKKAEPFRSGFVAIIGRPNVGKSTLMNHLLEEKVAIVTPKPQTTRNQIRGIRTTPTSQIIFLDTPGIHRARSLINQRMVDIAKGTLREVDVALWIIDAKEGLSSENEDIAQLIADSGKT
ncbi:MAG: GTPase Era, partial [Deltaproteobacteria bacterium]|nr:GTPase Era [Deltaproteobacteria bacterium]